MADGEGRRASDRLRFDAVEPYSELKVHGPSSKELLLTADAGNELNPIHVWTGMCTSRAFDGDSRRQLLQPTLHELELRGSRLTREMTYA